MMVMEKEWIDLAIEKSSTVKGVNVQKLTELTEDMGQLLLLQEVLSKSNIYFDIKLRKTAPSKSKPRTKKEPISSSPKEIRKTKKPTGKKIAEDTKHIDVSADFNKAKTRKKRIGKAKAKA